MNMAPYPLHSYNPGTNDTYSLPRAFACPQEGRLQLAYKKMDQVLCWLLTAIFHLGALVRGSMPGHSWRWTGGSVLSSQPEARGFG